MNKLYDVATAWQVIGILLSKTENVSRWANTRAGAALDHKSIEKTMERGHRNILILTRAPRGTDRLPEYNEHFYYKLDFLANQKAWQPYLWNQSEKWTQGQKALNQAQPKSTDSILAINKF